MYISGLKLHIRLFKIVITSQIMSASQTSGPPKNIEKL